MRVSTSQIYNTGINGILRNQSDLLTTQNQLATGRRVVVPSDDPVAASRALVVTQAQSVNQRYITNQGLASDSLKMTESKLQDVTNLVQNVLDRVVQAGNTSLSDANRQQIAKELRQRYDELTAIANTQDGEGNYIFSGYKTGTQPFPTSNVANNPSGSSVPGIVMAGVATPAGAGVYAGDDGRRELQVDSSRDMPTSEPGSEVFIQIRDKNGNVTNESVFTTLKNVIENLETPLTSANQAAFQASYNQSLNNLHAALDNTTRITTAVGARQAELDSMGDTSSNLSIQYKSTLSDLQDLDYASAISSLSKQQVVLSAAQKSYVQITSLGLFNNI